MRELGLKELIEKARDDLMELDEQARSGESRPSLRVEEVVVELNVIIEESTEGKGGFDLKVITAGTSTSRDDTQVQKVTVRLVPMKEGSLKEETFENGPYENLAGMLAELPPDDDDDTVAG